MYAGVDDRMRAMTAVELSRLTGEDAELRTEAALPPVVRVGTAILLPGLVFIPRPVRQSVNAIDYEVERALRLGS